MPRIGKRDPEKERFWRDKVERQRKSGLSQQEFCEREGVNSGTFNCWISILKTRDAEAKEAAKQALKAKKQRAVRKHKDKPLFVSVASPGTNAGPSPDRTVAQIVFAGGCVNVFSGTDLAIVQAVIHALKEGPGARIDRQHQDIPVHGRYGYAQEF